MNPVPQSEPESPLFPRPVQAALGLICLLIAVGLGFRAWHLTAGASRPLDLQSTFPLDLNNATLVELELLPGIGPTLAQRLVEYREARGGFRDVADLHDIPGIGPMLFEQLRERVCIGPIARQASPTEPPDVYPARTPKRSTGVMLDPNTATTEELMQMRGIGVVLADRIIEARRHAPFTSVDDLRRVRGLGPKTLENIRANIRIGR